MRVSARRTNCDASRISAGVLFGDSAPAEPNHAKHFQKSAHYLFIRSHILLNSFPNRSKTHQKPSQNLSKSTRNRAKRPLGPHLRPMLEKRAISNTKETFKKRLRVHKRQPRLSQTPPKWGPRPSQNRFFSDFLAFVFPF